MTWEAVIGLEVHVQLATASKAFSPSAVAFGAPPNSLTDPIVLGLPGALPAFNQRALALALVLGVATSSQIRARSRFARKHYFYPDLPKGYQITQSEEPLCENGHLDILVGHRVKRVKLARIHLEEDAGKNTHRGAISDVDFNRAGVALVEVVSAPELGSADEAAEFMRSLHRLVRWLELSEADMEKGQLRCDANVSLRRSGETALGTRTELKNINSFRFVHAAVEHEIARQTEILDAGGTIVAETRLWDADAGRSEPMRSKEDAADYRFLPEPDLPPLVVDGPTIGGVLRGMPELPLKRFERYVALGIAPEDARTLVGERALSDYFEAAGAASAAGPSQPIANWLLNELRGALTMPPAALAALVGLVESGAISGKTGKDILAESLSTGEAPAAIVERRDLGQISDEAALWEVVDRVVGAHGTQAEAYLAGKDGLFGFFVGAVMKETRGRANPVITADLLHKRLGR
ncbi:MAG TPA: Asp-tRNA(Asn)/Glu-tRNA(Gln) amidotransferase subunit GatB [Kofleriaceae bacterium]